MTAATAKQAVAAYLRSFPGGSPRVRFFGGEPLMRFGLLRGVVEGFPRRRGRPAPAFSFPTNGTLIDGKVCRFLRRHPEVEAAVSRVRSARALRKLPNILISVCIPPDGPSGLPRYTAKLLGAGLRRLNFLPAFFVRWTPSQLRSLEKALRTTGGLLREWAERGGALEVRNLTVRNPGPLFNHGMVVDTDGDVFPSNAALSVPFRHLRRELNLGSVKRPRSIDFARAKRIRWDDIYKEHLDASVYRSTMRVDDLLTDFVRDLRGHVHNR